MKNLIFQLPSIKYTSTSPFRDHVVFLRRGGLGRENSRFRRRSNDCDLWGILLGGRERERTHREIELPYGRVNTAVRLKELKKYL
jgi:hypothetical protein